MEYASKGTANTALGLSIGSGVLSLLNGGANILGMAPTMTGAAEDRHVTHRELDMFEKLVTSERNNAILAADNTTDKKLVEVYAKLESRDKEIRQEMEAMRRDQEAINREQAVYNGVNTATVKCIRNDVDALLEMAPRKIRNDSVCPGWGPVKVSPETPT